MIEITAEELKKLLQEAAEAGATKAINKLKESGRITYCFTGSFKKTEEVLYLYPKLREDHPERKRIDEALKAIEDDEYCDVIASRYFDGLSIAEIAEIYDCKYQNISKHRNKLVKKLAAELFPEDVLSEILQR
jgi:RNA polymerase sigma factor (sigma-70 family)